MPVSGPVLSTYKSPRSGPNPETVNTVTIILLWGQEQRKLPSQSPLCSPISTFVHENITSYYGWQLPYRVSCQDRGVINIYFGFYFLFWNCFINDILYIPSKVAPKEVRPTRQRTTAINHYSPRARSTIVSPWAQKARILDGKVKS